MSHLPASYRAFLLRLWQTPETPGGWRASLEDPHTGERRAFGSLAELTAFLAQAPAEVSGPVSTAETLCYTEQPMSSRPASTSTEEPGES